MLQRPVETLCTSNLAAQSSSRNIEAMDHVPTAHVAFCVGPAVNAESCRHPCNLSLLWWFVRNVYQLKREFRKMNVHVRFHQWQLPSSMETGRSKRIHSLLRMLRSNGHVFECHGALDRVHAFQCRLRDRLRQLERLHTGTEAVMAIRSKLVCYPALCHYVRRTLQHLGVRQDDCLLTHVDVDYVCGRFMTSRHVCSTFYGVTSALNSTFLASLVLQYLWRDQDLHCTLKRLRGDIVLTAEEIIRKCEEVYVRRLYVERNSSLDIVWPHACVLYPLLVSVPLEAPSQTFVARLEQLLQVGVLGSYDPRYSDVVRDTLCPCRILVVGKYCCVLKAEHILRRVCSDDDYVRRLRPFQIDMLEVREGQTVHLPEAWYQCCDAAYENGNLLVCDPENCFGFTPADIEAASIMGGRNIVLLVGVSYHCIMSRDLADCWLPRFAGCNDRVRSVYHIHHVQDDEASLAAGFEAHVMSALGQSYSLFQRLVREARRRKVTLALKGKWRILFRE